MPVHTATGCAWWAGSGSLHCLPSHPPQGGPAHLFAAILLWRWGSRGLPSSSISPLVSAPGGARPRALLSSYQDFCLVLSVGGSGDPVAGERSLGGGAQPCLPGSFLYPGYRRSSCNSQSPSLEACLAHLPVPPTTKKRVPFSTPGQGQVGQGWTRGRGVRLCPFPPPRPIST